MAGQAGEIIDIVTPYANVRWTRSRNTGVHFANGGDPQRDGWGHMGAPPPFGGVQVVHPRGVQMQQGVQMQGMPMTTAMPVAQTVVVAGGTDIATQLERLAQLRADGVLSQEEFDAAKMRALAAPSAAGAGEAKGGRA